MINTKKLLCVLLAVALMFASASFSLADRESEREATLRWVREQFADEPDVIDIEEIYLEDGTIAYKLVTGRETPDYEELMAALESLGMDEMLNRFAQAESDKEAGEIRLNWIISLEPYLSESLYQFLYEDTLNLITQMTAGDDYETNRIEAFDHDAVTKARGFPKIIHLTDCPDACDGDHPLPAYLPELEAAKSRSTCTHPSLSGWYQGLYTHF